MITNYVVGRYSAKKVLAVAKMLWFQPDTDTKGVPVADCVIKGRIGETVPVTTETVPLRNLELYRDYLTEQLVMVNAVISEKKNA